MSYKNKDTLILDHNNDFYKNLSYLDSFKDISNNSLFHSAPENWYVVVSDVVNSTKHIQEGRYKDINMIGALTILSVLNIDDKLDLPFVFGGDGAFLLIPKTIIDDTKQSLLAIKKISLENFHLELRVGIIPIVDIYKENKDILLSKIRFSKDHSQAVIKGGGLEFADLLLKQNDKYFIKDSINSEFEVNVEGLECRWEAIKTHKNETLSIIIKCFNENDYDSLFSSLDNILGENRNPIVKKNLYLSFKNNDLDKEASIHSSNSFTKYFINIKLKFINLLGLILMKYNIAEWKEYKSRVLSSTDTEKFDDMLRMVVSATYEQTNLLEEYLENLYKEKKLVYGIHKSKETLMTCLIFQRHGKHIHFVDGSNGGYAIAAKAFKSRFKSFK